MQTFAEHLKAAVDIISSWVDFDLTACPRIEDEIQCSGLAERMNGFSNLAVFFPEAQKRLWSAPLEHLAGFQAEAMEVGFHR